jgi:hypothetical protein
MQYAIAAHSQHNPRCFLVSSVDTTRLFARRYKTRFYKLEFGKSVVRTYAPEKSFGTIVVGIGFRQLACAGIKTRSEGAHSHKDKSHVKYPRS